MGSVASTKVQGNGAPLTKVCTYDTGVQTSKGSGHIQVIEDRAYIVGGFGFVIVNLENKRKPKRISKFSTGKLIFQSAEKCLSFDILLLITEFLLQRSAFNGRRRDGCDKR